MTETKMKPALHRLWRCASAVLLAVGLLTLALAVVQGAGSLTRITTASSPNTTSLFPNLSANGRKIVFRSSSDLLGQGITQTELWLYDTATMTFTRVTTTSSGRQIGFSPNLDANGTKLVFDSDSDFLGQGVTHYEIWLYDTTAMTLTRITTASPGNRTDILPVLSGDGTKIAFSSDSDFLGQGIPPGQSEIWLYDINAMTFTRITTASNADRDSGFSTLIGLSLSANGEKIAFASDSDFLGQGIPNDQYEIWLYDTATMTVTRITTASSSTRGSHFPSMNAAGTKVAFMSDSDFLGQGIPSGQLKIWLYDTSIMTITRVPTASNNDRISFHPSMSADGTKIAFMSDSDFLGQGIPPGQSEIWLYDTVTSILTRITTGVGSGSLASEAPSVNANGTKIAFHSYADFLGQGIPQTQAEIWLYQVLDKQIYLPLIFKN